MGQAFPHALRAFRLLASRTRRQLISIVLSHPLVVLGYGNCRKLIFSFSFPVTFCLLIFSFSPC